MAIMAIAMIGAMTGMKIAIITVVTVITMLLPVTIVRITISRLVATIGRKKDIGITIEAAKSCLPRSELAPFGRHFFSDFLLGPPARAAQLMPLPLGDTRQLWRAIAPPG